MRLRNLRQHGAGAQAYGHTLPTAACSQCVILTGMEALWVTYFCVHWVAAIIQGHSTALLTGR